MRARTGRVLRLGAALSIPLAVAGLAVAVFGVARVQNESMLPTLAAGDLIVYDRMTPSARGDIVLVDDPGSWSTGVQAVLVKRVIGVAGDTVECCEPGTGRLLVNDEPLAEEYVDDVRPGGTVKFRVTLPPGSVWLMGDNRAASRDSRTDLAADSHGAVPTSAIRGVARLLWG